MKQLVAFLIVCVLSSGLHAADASEARGYVRSPMAVHDGIVFTDNYGSAIYLRSNDGVVRKAAASAGIGNYFAVSRDAKMIGVKIIDENGLQAPAVIDAASGAVRVLAVPSPKAGQVSFLDDGKYAYTIGNELIVSDGAALARFDLGTYANCAPVSPDGRYAAFNDAHDQLWVIDLSTRSTHLITDGKFGYFNPQWSADSRMILYSSLHGHLFVYNRSTAETVSLGEGYAPTWSSDGRDIAFYKKEIAGDSLVNTDIFLAAANGSSERQVTFTPDICEMDPSFTAGDASIVYHTNERSEIGTVSLSDAAQRTKARVNVDPVDVGKTFSFIRPAHAASRLVNVPYINQVYDTPNWFNGHSACGPTTAMMVLAYYNILPPWETSCSKPTQHINYWGSYISEVYTFHAITYNASADDPNGRPGQGAFGYMWSFGSPYSRMANYYANHGIQAATYDSPSNSTAAAEVAAGNVYSICNGLTTAGHIVLAHDVDPADPHIVIVNDPYGDKNRPGYPNYYGKDARYDWPGYNFGNQNFNTVYWATTTRYTPPAPADSIVDDMQVDNGFYLNAKSPASMAMWKYKAMGYKNHFWFIFTTYSQDIDTCYAVWTPTLDKDGRYEVFAYIPHYTAAYSSIAKYKICSKAGLQTVTVNQQTINAAITQDTLVSLGTYDFAKGSSGYVRLGDATGIKNEVIVLDAMMWKYRGASVTAVPASAAKPGSFALDQNYPNPFNPSTQIQFTLPEASTVVLTVFDVLGREVAELANGQMSAGAHVVRWDAGAIPGGVYYYRLTARTVSSENRQTFIGVKKLSYIK